jgi:integrase
VSRDPKSGERRRTYQTVYGTRKDAERVLREVLHQRDNGFERLPGKMSVAEFLNRWLDDYAAINVAPSTASRYRIAVSKHLAPHLGPLQLTSLRPVHVQRMHATCLGEGLSPRTVVQHHRILSEALKHAVRWQLIPANPAAAISPPRFERREMRFLTNTEYQDLLAAAEGSYLRPLIYLAVHTGARSGELLALRWSDIDFERRRLAVTRTVQRIAGEGLVFASPKTHRSRRPITLSADAIAFLREHRSAQNQHRLRLGPAFEDHGLVFCRPSGRALEPNAISQDFARLARTAGLQGLRFHDLRHTMASLMLAAGINPKVVSERLGHATVHITLDTYSHLLLDLQQEAADVMDSLLGTRRAKGAW